MPVFVTLPNIVKQAPGAPASIESHSIPVRLPLASCSSVSRATLKTCPKLLKVVTVQPPAAFNVPGDGAPPPPPPGALAALIDDGASGRGAVESVQPALIAAPSATRPTDNETRFKSMAGLGKVRVRLWVVARHREAERADVLCALPLADAAPRSWRMRDAAQVDAKKSISRSAERAAPDGWADRIETVPSRNGAFLHGRRMSVHDATGRRAFETTPREDE